ncbi:substrate-binding domain-containing protein [Agreia pratensis]|uniref:substrate-binding domain-containing protein n=1 Tax=Agreia pratensis TaxID=150121 RepID=UPI001E39A46E|nr:substrate-binding domain-containing protein [Agreia pratensis]
MSKVNRIAILSHRIDETGPARILRGMIRSAQERGYVAEIIWMDGVDATSVDMALNLATEHQVAGILASAQNDVVLERLTARSITVPIVIDAHVTEESSSVLLDELIGRMCAEHLLDLGHRQVGYLSGPEPWFAARERRKGFVETIENAGGEVLWSGAGDWSSQSGYATWRSAEMPDLGITAVAAGNDSMAIGLIAAAAESGLRVPEDLSVIGTDDLPEARFLVPSPLTTIVVDFEGEGQRMTNELLNLIDPPQSSGQSESQSPPRLEVRASTRRIV